MTPHRLLVPATRLGRLAAGAYLLLVVASLVFFTWATLSDSLEPSASPSLAGIWPIFATAPTSMVLLSLVVGIDATSGPDLPDWFSGRTGLIATTTVLTLACALVNIALATLVARLAARIAR